MCLYVIINGLAAYTQVCIRPHTVLIPLELVTALFWEFVFNYVHTYLSSKRQIAIVWNVYRAKIGTNVARIVIIPSIDKFNVLMLFEISITTGEIKFSPC